MVKVEILLYSNLRGLYIENGVVNYQIFMKNFLFNFYLNNEH